MFISPFLVKKINNKLALTKTSVCELFEDSVLYDMMLFDKIKKYIRNFFASFKEINPKNAYDLWSESYDIQQPANLLITLDEKLFNDFMEKVSFTNKIIVDIGCGTGRNWKKIFATNPTRLIGYDVSLGMLNVLKKKFPQSETYQLKDGYSLNLNNETCDFIISNLVIGHIENIKNVFKEWNRVLKVSGEIFVTDCHPEIFLKGGNSTFLHDNKSVYIKKYIHTIEELKNTALEFHFELIDFKEKIIDKSLKQSYDQYNATSTFEQFLGVPLIYAIHLRKKHNYI